MKRCSATFIKDADLFQVQGIQLWTKKKKKHKKNPDFMKLKSNKKQINKTVCQTARSVLEIMRQTRG